MALVPIGMANDQVAMFEANNPVIRSDVQTDIQIPSPAVASIEYQFIPASPAAAPGGEPDPVWEIGLTTLIEPENSTGDFGDVVVIFAPSSGEPNESIVPTPVFEWGAMSYIETPIGFFSVGSGPSEMFLTSGQTLLYSNPGVAYSMYISVRPSRDDTATYFLRRFRTWRKDIA